jgi:hypothetical protein
MNAISALSITICLWSFFPPAFAEPEEIHPPASSLECPVAEGIAEKSYDRAAIAFNVGDKNAAIMYSKSFWDVYELSSSCDFVKKLADKLNGIGITSSSVVAVGKPGLTINPITPNILGGLCQNPPCKVKVSTPSIGSSTGKEPIKINGFGAP